MVKKMKDDPFSLKIRELKKQAREKIKDELLKEYEKCKSQGKYPWEGVWISPHDIEKVQKILKKRDRMVFAEVITFFFFFGIITYVLYKLLKVFILP